MVQFQYKINDPMGLHARPASLLVSNAKVYKDTSIVISCNGRSADCKRMFAVMMLQLKKDDVVTVTVEGDNEREVADKLHGLFVEQHF